MNEQVLAQPVADSTLHPLEQLAATNPDAEIWWDSSPLIFPSWSEETLAKAPEGQLANWTAQVDRFYDAETIANQGTMGFRGVTTNPPLSLQAIKLAPALWVAEIKTIAAKNPGLDYEGVYWAMYLDLVKKGATELSIKDLKGKYVVVAFYPKALTGG
jgi:transaldolase